MRRALLWRLPILCGLAMIAVPSLLVYGNAAHGLVAGVPMYENTKLVGVQPPIPEATLSWTDVLWGAYGRHAAAVFDRNFPLLRAAGRMKAQIIWWIFHQSSTWYVEVGQHDVLYETDYTEEYCARDIAAAAPGERAWAGKLRKIQDWYAAQGKVFLYLLTPSKPAIEPEFLRRGWPCPASRANRTGFHDAYRAILDAAGIHVVDGVETTLEAKADYPFPPFPQGGVHFNTVSAARTAQQLITVMTQASTWRRMDEFSFTWHMAAPNDVDTDLLDSLNIPDSGIHYQTPAIDIAPASTAMCQPVVMAQVGGSFTYQVDKVLQRLACPPAIDFYEYYHTTMAFYPGDRRYPVDANRRRWMLLDAAQVVVLEENEELAAHSDHGKAFASLVINRMAQGR